MTLPVWRTWKPFCSESLYIWLYQGHPHHGLSLSRLHVSIFLSSFFENKNVEGKQMASCLGALVTMGEILLSVKPVQLPQEVRERSHFLLSPSKSPCMAELPLLWYTGNLVLLLGETQNAIYCDWKWPSSFLPSSAWSRGSPCNWRIQIISFGF